MNNADIQYTYNIVKDDSVYNKLCASRALSFCSGIRNYNPTSILDVGCRMGAALKIFDTIFPDARIVGVDIVPQFVEAASSIAEVKLADIQELPFKDCEFRWTFCSHTLEHAQDVPRAIGELYRVTEAGVFIVVPLESEENRLKNNPSHGANYEDPIDWLKLCQRPGWTLISAKVSSYADIAIFMLRINT